MQILKLSRQWDPTRLKIAAGSTAAVVIGYGLALQFNWKASWVATTIIVLQTPTFGATLSKASLRIVGTMIGAIVGVAMVSLFAQSRECFIGAMSLMAAVCVWGGQGSRHQYAWMLALLTCAIVGWSGSSQPESVFLKSVDRVTAVSMGILLSAVAHGILWPVRADRKFELAVHELLVKSRHLLGMVQNQLSGSEQDATEFRSLQTQLISQSASLPELLEAARAENRRLDRCYANFLELCHQLEDLTLATAGIADVMVIKSEELMPGNESDVRRLHEIFQQLDEACDMMLRCFSAARDGQAFPEQSDLDSKLGILHVPDAAATPATTFLRERCQSFLQTARAGCESLTCLETAPGDRLEEAHSPASAAHVAHRFRKSALAAVQLAMAAVFLIQLNWPLGLQSSMIVISSAIFLNANIPVSLAGRTLLKSVIVALLIAGVFHFFLMPRLDGFLELSPCLAILFFPFFYRMASPNPLLRMSGLISIIFINTLVSISNSPPNYQFASFANMSLGMGGGVTIVLFIAYLFETRNPRQGFLKTLNAICAEMSASFQADRKEPSAASNKRQHRPIRQTLLQQHKQLTVLLGLIRYRQKPDLQLPELQSLIGTLGILVMRALWVEAASPSAERESSDVNNLRTWCAGTLATAGRSLSERCPVAVESIDEKLLRRLGSSESSLAYHSLVESLMDFQRNLTSVDWRKWTQNCF